MPPSHADLPPALARAATKSRMREQRKSLAARKSREAMSAGSTSANDVTNDVANDVSPETPMGERSMLNRAKTVALSLTNSATSILGATPPPPPKINNARPRIGIQGTRWFTPTLGSLEVVQCHVKASATIWWNPFKGHLVISLRKRFPSKVTWDIELGVGRYDLDLPDWLENHALNGLTNLILLTLSRTNPIFIDLNAVDEATQQAEAANKLQAIARARKARLSSPVPTGGGSRLRRSTTTKMQLPKGATKLDELESLAKELKDHEVAIDDHNRQAKYVRERMEGLMRQLRKQQLS